MARLIKIDRNGTRYYEGERECDRCSGKGIYYIGVCNGHLVASPVDSGVCFKCLGSGVVMDKWTERTPEYEAKLQARRQAKADKAKQEAIAKFDALLPELLSKKGFNSDGYIYIAYGNTYPIKDELKALGARWQLGYWMLPTKPEICESISVHYSDIIKTNAEYGTIIWSDDAYTFIYESIENANSDKETETFPESDYYGEEGQKVNIEAKLVKSAHFEVRDFYRRYSLTTMYAHSFRDSEGHIFVWKTGKCLSVNENDKVTLSGTIKEHSVYNEEKQTVLTRCTVTALV